MRIDRVAEALPNSAQQSRTAFAGGLFVSCQGTGERQPLPQDHL